MWKFKKKQFIGISIIGWALIIFILCSLPGRDLPNPYVDVPFLDKIVHFCMFFLFTFLITIATVWYSSITFARLCLIAVSISFFYGGFIEIAQHYLFHRSGEWLDLIADLLGGVAGCCSYPLIKYIKKKN